MKTRGARLGQHFLIHSWAARKLAYAVAPQEGEVIVEIGPGKGVLTRELLKLGPVLAIEKDEALVEKIKETFKEEAASGHLMLLARDIRDFNPRSSNLDARRYIVAANIPYYITGEIIRQFLTADIQPRSMALLVQKEVAQRIVDTRESILSLSVKAYGTPRIIAKVGKSHFSPSPSVDSAILLIENISKNFFDSVSEEDFFNVVRTGFTSKRKFLSSNLGSRFGVRAAREALNSCTLQEKVRAEEIRLADWKCVTQHFLEPGISSLEPISNSPPSS